MTRGENWPLASCNATIVMLNTRPVNVIIAAAIVDNTLRAASAPPVNPSLAPVAWSSATVPNPASTASDTPAAGITHRLVRTYSTTRSTRFMAIGRLAARRHHRAGMRAPARIVPSAQMPSSLAPVHRPLHEARHHCPGDQQQPDQGQGLLEADRHRQAPDRVVKLMWDGRPTAS